MPNQCTANPPMRDPASGAGVERLEQRPRQHALPAGGGRAPHGGRRAAPEAEVGLRHPARHDQQRAADRRRRAACSWPPTTATSTRSTRRPAASTGRSRTARSSATRRWSAPSPDRAARGGPCSSATATPTSSRSTRRPAGSCGRCASTITSWRASPRGVKYHDGRRLRADLGLRGVQRPANRTTRAARRAAASPRSTRTPASRSGRPTTSTSRSRGRRTRTACSCTGPRPAASGTRRRSIRCAARSTSAPATPSRRRSRR